MEQIVKAIINGTHEVNIDQDQEIDLIENADGTYHLIHNHGSYSVEVIDIDLHKKKIVALINNERHEIDLFDKLDIRIEKMGLNLTTKSGSEECIAPMPGLVLDVHVASGQEIKAGDPVLILEAMKMENVIKAPQDGEIGTVLVSSGDKVEKGQTLIEFAK